MEKLFAANNCLGEGFYNNGNYVIRVKHIETLNSITVLSMSEAYRVSRLLNLEYIINAWYNKEREIK